MLPLCIAQFPANIDFIPPRSHLQPGKEPGASAFAFLEYDDPRDADDALRARDGHELAGARLRIELAKGNFISVSSRGPPRRSGFRARVTGLPESASWQVRIARAGVSKLRLLCLAAPMQRSLFMPGPVAWTWLACMRLCVGMDWKLRPAGAGRLAGDWPRTCSWIGVGVIL
jgi:hypothetical protein